MNILFLTCRPYLPQKIGGVESNTHQTIQALEARGHSCAVLAGLSPDRSVLTMGNRLKAKVLHHKLPVDQSMGYPVARVWNVPKHLEEAKARFSPDVAILLPTDGKAAELSCSLARIGIKSVLHLHDVEFGELGDPHCMCLSGIFACSRFTARSFEKTFNLHCKVSLNIFRREDYECAPAGNYVTFINPVDVKGKGIAIELARLNPEIPFLFVEGWKLKPDERAELIRIMEVLPNIRWHRSVSDMREIYKLTRVLLVPSQWEEASGRVVTEAQMSGIPVLASRVGGLPDSVGKGGMLIEPQDIDGWDDALKNIWSDEKVWTSLSELALEHSLRAELNPLNIAEDYEKALYSFIK